jgi:hypothetical protein
MPLWNSILSNSFDDALRPDINRNVDRLNRRSVMAEFVHTRENNGKLDAWYQSTCVVVSKRTKLAKT